MVTDRKDKPVHYVDYQLMALFEGICEQVMDFKGIDEGQRILERMFPDFRDALLLKIEAFRQGARITRKTKEPDPQIVRICEGYE